VLELGQDRIREHVVALNARLTDGLTELSGVRILGPREAERRSGICNFVMDGTDSYELARRLNQRAGIMVRAGRHCVHSWYHATGTPDSVRVSFGPYNTRDEVDSLLGQLRPGLRTQRRF
jgi:cysteine desulfurase/selenocysteine lyase